MSSVSGVISENSETSIKLSEKVIDTGHVVLVSGEEGNVNVAVKSLSQLM